MKGTLFKEIPGKFYIIGVLILLFNTISILYVVKLLFF